MSDIPSGEIRQGMGFDLQVIADGNSIFCSMESAELLGRLLLQCRLINSAGYCRRVK